MTGLVLKLKPQEKLLINGALVQNGNRSAVLRVKTTDVSILRKRDALRPEDAKTPLKRIYYIAQLALVKEANAIEAREQILFGLNEVATIFPGDASVRIEKARKGAEDQKFFTVMQALKPLFSLEARLLDDFSSV